MSDAVKDTNGRAYLAADTAAAGSRIEVDDGFTCIGEGQQRQIQQDDGGLFFECKDGQHYLAGQFNDAATHYVGVYPA